MVVPRYKKGMTQRDFNFRCKHPASLAGLSLVLLTFVVFAAHPYVRPAVIYDEGFALTNALRVLRGDLPFQDFWTVYPPGTSYVLAMFFSLLEPSLEVSRWVHLAWMGVITTFTYLLLTRIASALYAATTTVFVTAWTCLALSPSYSMAPAIALAFVSLTALVCGCKNNSTLFGAAGGVAGGLIALFRHDLSAYLLLSALGCYVALCALGHGSCRTNTHRLLRSYLLLYAGAGLASVAVILFRSGIEPVIDQTLMFPSLIQRDQRFLPFPTLLSLGGSSTDLSHWLLAWLSPMMLCLAVAFLSIWRLRLSEGALLIAIIAGSTSSLLLFQAFGRLDVGHAAPSLIFAAVTLAAITGTTSSKLPVTLRAASLIAIGVFSIFSAQQLSDRFDPRAVASCIYGKSICPRTAGDQNAAINFINRNFAADEPIFVGNRRHDRIHINDALLYFRLNRPIPTKWSEMHPGEVTTAEVQSEIVKELKSRDVRAVILFDMPSGREKNASAESSGVHILDTYLFSQFSSIWRQGRYTVLLRHW